MLTPSLMLPPDADCRHAADYCRAMMPCRHFRRRYAFASTPLRWRYADTLLMLSLLLLLRHAAAARC